MVLSSPIDDGAFGVVCDPDGEGGFRSGTCFDHLDVAQMLHNAAFSYGTVLTWGGARWEVVRDTYLTYAVERQMLREVDGVRVLVSLNFRLGVKNSC